MHFESGGIYHIYNQGNNRQKIFFSRKNYMYFVQKIEYYVKPYGNILAWCLMPNHFHLMMEVESVAIGVTSGVNSEGVTSSHLFTKIHPATMKLRTLNDSIGIMLRSYTRAVNIQENRTGNLFREETKAISLNELKGVSSDWYTSFGIAFMNVQIPELQYPQSCFNYIHANPVKAGLVKKPEDWEFSSYADLKSLRDGNLVSRKRVIELALII
jgi:putative transposase